MELSSISLTHKSQKGDDCFGRIRPNGPPNVFIGGRHSLFEGNLRAIGQSKIEITLQVPKVQEFVTRQDVLRVKYNGEGRLPLRAGGLSVLTDIAKPYRLIVEQ